MIERCLMIARFQPLHYGHLRAITYCREIAGEVIIAVGMASQSHTPENPFTAGERIEMIRRTLKWAGLNLNDFITVTIPTLEVSRVSVHYVKLYSPPFTKVVSLNPIIRRLFVEEGYTVLTPPIESRDKLRGSYIRKLMVKGDDWKELVPPPVIEVINEVDGVNRVRMLYRERLPGYYVIDQYVDDYD
ncbi:MAG: nicotinamide-nucleotide adenylyltransferase [Desulfurococcaceae archaeon]